MENNKILNVAVIGCGRISLMHLESCKMLGHNLVAVCDIKEDVAKATAEKYGCKAYTDYNEMLDNEKLDAVHICLPHYIHCKVSCAAIERGVAVLCEKPMDVSYEAAEKAVKFAEERGVLFGIIFQCRYNNSAQLVKRAYDEGKLGKNIGSDAEMGKITFMNYYSVDEARELAATLTEEAMGAISDFEGADTLKKFALYLLERDH